MKRGPLCGRLVALGIVMSAASTVVIAVLEAVQVLPSSGLPVTYFSYLK